jgi:hypothetical protein
MTADRSLLTCYQAAIALSLVLTQPALADENRRETLATINGESIAAAEVERRWSPLATASWRTPSERSSNELLSSKQSTADWFWRI